MPKCCICDNKENNKFKIFDKLDGTYICKVCIETKYQLKDLFKDLIIEQSKDEGLTEDARDRLIASYI